METNPRKINAKSVAKYMLLPGIIPRAKELGGSGFGYLAFLFAQVYLAVRILPPTHPYVQARNIGTFGIRQVIAEAASNIKFTRRNIDQIIVFVAILAGVALLALQFLLFIIMLLSGTAFAQEGGDAPFINIFTTQYPEHDIAFMMLDYVFGIPDIFGSHVIGDAGPTPFHQGMHALFEFYNLAILLVGALIFLYYIVVVVVETAQTGVPFGRRFSKIYAPFRLIFAVALLVPIPPYGFNTAQYATFYVAKLGSGFATNGWILFNENTSNPMGSPNSALVAASEPPEIDSLFLFSSVYHACREMYNIYVHKEYAVAGGGSRETVQIKPYIIVDDTAKEFQSYTYDDANKHFGQNDIEILLGELDTDKHTSYQGGVNPYCGKFTISLSNDNPSMYEGNGEGRGSSRGEARGGVRTIEMEYYQLIRRLLTDESSKFSALGERAAHAYVSTRSVKDGGMQDFCYGKGTLGDEDSCDIKNPFPSIDKFQTEIDKHKENVQSAIDIGIQELRDGIDMGLTDEMAKYGWGGAGMWFNRVAEINGSVTSAIYAAPGIKNWPEAMEEVRKHNAAANVEQGECQTYDPHLSGGQDIVFSKTHNRNIAIATNELFQYWCKGQSAESAMPATMTGNAVNDMIGAIFGINGLFSLRKDTRMDETTHMPVVHPFAAMTAIGKSLVENAIRSMGISIGVSLGSGIVGIASKYFGAAAQNISSMFVSIATLGLTAGFILYYILPFLPFIYFFFAVSSWVKSIFEAMVGVPLWALAHLRIDGDGFSGQAALQGYFLLFEIFLRPIATVFGLISSMAVFGATIAVLNKVFTLVVGNIVGNTEATGSDLPVGIIDQFLFTMMYTILVYLIGNACFKMIDTIPKAFMRWLGTSPQTFNDNAGDPTGNLTTYTAVAGNSIVPQIFGNINQGASTVSGLAGSIGSAATKPPPATQ